MRIISFIFTAAALMQGTLSFAANVASVDDCAAKSQSDMRSCLEKNSSTSERELAAAQQAAFSALARWDEDPKYMQAASAALKASAKSFLQFRQAQCDFVASLGGGAIGNALALRRLRCMTDLNSQQAASIQQVVANLPVK